MTTERPREDPHTEHRAPPRPGYLYHYTGISSFHKIIDSGTLWASHTNSLNDLQEAQVLPQQLRALMRALAMSERKRGNRGSAAFLDRLVSGFEMGVHDAFVASFSEDSNSLSQWRAYGGTGNSVAIGWTKETLTRAAEVAGASLAACTYVKPGFNPPDDLVSRLQAIVESARKTTEVPADDASPIIVPDLYIELSRLAPQYKDSAYWSEAEWRVIAPTTKTTSPIKWRVDRGQLVSFIELNVSAGTGNLGNLHVVVGPSPDSSDTVDRIRKYLGTTPWGKGSTVESSNIAYRSKQG